MPQLTKQISAQISFLEAPQGCLIMQSPARKGSRFGTYLLCINPTEKAHAYQAPGSFWTLLCDGERSDLWIDASVQAEQPMVLPAGSVVIIAR